MFELIRSNQLTIMLLLCGACAILAFLVFHTRFMSGSRKCVLILMELMALLLLWFDRLSYIYAGDTSSKGSIMVRLSNFMVFFLTPGMAFGMTLYLADWLKHEGHMKKLPLRLTLTGAAAIGGMVLAVIAACTDLYYYFDETNHYHRGGGFLLSYIIPVVCPLIQFSVVKQYKKLFSRLIYYSLTLYIFVPVLCGILQIFTYGISIVNMAMVLVSISLYVFTYLDINNTVEHAHEIEIQSMQGERKRMQKLFDQTAMAFVSAIEQKDDFAKGTAVRTARYARRIAEAAGKDETECENVYYAALLHDVGILGIPDSVIKNEYDPKTWDREMMQQKPLIGKEILSSITEYPYLCQGAQYSHERYNGTGYPEGLKGEEIPEIARIVAVADAYVTMTTRKRFREARPDFIAREALVKGAGEAFDPLYANIMISIIDHDSSETAPEDPDKPETGIVCHEYRDHLTKGIPIEKNMTRITFDCRETDKGEHKFHAPAVILFDAYDRRVHDNEKAIQAYQYLEYGEIWFDQNCITTAARKMEITSYREKVPAPQDSSGHYEILMGRYSDHLKLKLSSPYSEKEVIAALPNGVKSAYACLTGEYCELSHIRIHKTEDIVQAEDIPRIAEEISCIDRMESDIPNVQVNRNRSASTIGVEVKKRLRVAFHTMSLPGAELVWHCPYIVLFCSADGTVNGPDYREYALIKLYGENEGTEEYAHNNIIMKKKQEFPGWDVWKEKNRKGMECEICLERKGSRIRTTTENLGIRFENTTEIMDAPEKVYVALTGDQVALTDIRVKQYTV